MDTDTRKRRHAQATAATKSKDAPLGRSVKAKNPSTTDLVAEATRPRFVDEDVCDLLRMRLPPITYKEVRDHERSVRAFCHDPLDTATARAERSTFCQTMHAVESGNGSVPAGHVARPPTVVWALAEAGSLAALGHDPASALTPTAMTPPPRTKDGKETCSEAYKGPWFIPPDLDTVLARGEDGYGSPHCRMPMTIMGRGLEVQDHMSVSQRWVMEEQNSASINLPHRIRHVFWTLRNKHGRSKSRHFTIAEFMAAVEFETSERLVHISVRKKKKRRGWKRPPLRDFFLTIRLGYALDAGGRYFFGMEWEGLEWPPVPLGGSLDTPRWWGNAVVGDSATWHRFRYLCQCRLQCG